MLDHIKLCHTKMLWDTFTWQYFFMLGSFQPGLLFPFLNATFHYNINQWNIRLLFYCWFIFLRRFFVFRNMFCSSDDKNCIERFRSNAEIGKQEKKRRKKTSSPLIRSTVVPIDKKISLYLLGCVSSQQTSQYGWNNCLFPQTECTNIDIHAKRIWLDSADTSTESIN